MEWFSSVILSRGYDYYTSGAVSDITKTDTGYEATVYGSEPYDVKVEIMDDCLLEADCSCPYASDGSCCKHEAALLYCIGNMSDEDLGDDEEGNHDLQHIIADMRIDDMRNLLLSIAENNEDIRTRILYEYSDGVPDQLVNDIRNGADRYLSKLINDRIYYDEYFMQSIIGGFNDFIEDRIRGLLDKRNCNYTVFRLSADILDGIPFSDLYEYGYDSIYDIDCALYDLMVDSYDSAGAEERSKIEETARSRLCSGYRYEDFIIYAVKDRSLAEARLRKLMSRMDGEEFQRPYDEVIKLMDLLGYPEDKVIDFMKEHISSVSVRNCLISRLYESGCWEECIAILLDCKAEPFFEDGRKLLKRIYREHGLTGELKQFLIDDVCSRTQHDLCSIKELRELLSEEEWEDLLIKLKGFGTIRYIEDSFLEYAEDWPALMDYAEKNPMVFGHSSYRKKLESLYTDRAVSVYELNADTVERYMQNRKEYAEYAAWLKKMCITEEGHARARKKAEWIMQEHPRHRALHDELMKAGF